MKFDFFDRDFNHLDFTNGHPNATKLIEKPVCWAKMIELAEKLSENIPHVRVDLYVINGSIYFGEMTFTAFSGMNNHFTMEFHKLIGDRIHLPEVKTN